MTDGPDPQKSESSRKRPTLEYQPPEAGSADGPTWDYRDLVLGAVLMIIGMGLFLVLNVRIATPFDEGRRTGPLASFLAIGGVLGGIAYYKWRAQRSLAFAAGLLLGLGMGILLLGLCSIAK